MAIPSSKGTQIFRFSYILNLGRDTIIFRTEKVEFNLTKPSFRMDCRLTLQQTTSFSAPRREPSWERIVWEGDAGTSEIELEKHETITLEKIEPMVELLDPLTATLLMPEIEYSWQILLRTLHEQPYDDHHVPVAGYTSKYFVTEENADVLQRSLDEISRILEI